MTTLAEQNKALLREFELQAQPNLRRGCSGLFSCVYRRADDHAVIVAAALVLGPATPLSVFDRGVVVSDLRGLGAFRVALNDPIELIGSVTLRGEIAPSTVKNMVDRPLRLVTGKDYHGPAPRLEFETAESLAEHRIRFPGHRLKLYGDHLYHHLPGEERQVLDSLLPANDPPFADLGDLCRTLGLMKRFEDGGVSVFSFVSPTWLRLSSVNRGIAERRIEIVVETWWDDVGSEAKSPFVNLDR